MVFQNQTTISKCNISIIFILSVSQIRKIVQIPTAIYIGPNKITVKSLPQIQKLKLMKISTKNNNNNNKEVMDLANHHPSFETKNLSIIGNWVYLRFPFSLRMHADSK
jgi:hypothetical protein